MSNTNAMEGGRVVTAKAEPVLNRSGSVRGGSETSGNPFDSRGRQHSAEVLDTAMRVMTPENISFEFQVAGPFRRIFAYGLDILLSIVAFCLLMFVMWLIFALGILPLFEAAGLKSFMDELASILWGLTLASYFVVYWFYGAITETYLNGQTFGKRICRMRVMTVDGHAIDGVQATLRNFFRLLDMAPLIGINTLFGGQAGMMYGALPTCLVGLVVMTINRNYQRLGDIVAGTVVIHEEPRQLNKLATFPDPRVASLAEMIPANFSVSRKLGRAISDYVDHRQRLAPARANEIAGHVAVPLMERFGLPSDTNADLFLCALYFRTFITDRQATDQDAGELLALAKLKAGSRDADSIESPSAGVPVAAVTDSELNESSRADPQEPSS